MPISKHQLRNYYFGMGIESYVMSQLQMMNCQVSKLNPDFGFDLHVTNIAATQYLGANNVDQYIQVKSRIYRSSQKTKKYQFRINQSDYNLIQNTPNALVVFVIAKPQIYGDPLSFEEDRGQIFYLDEQIETSAITYFFNGSPSKARNQVGYSEIADKVKGYDLSYIWCNKNHLNNYQQECPKTVRGDYAFDFAISDELSFSFNGHLIVKEQHNLWFAVNPHSSSQQLADGDSFGWWDK